ncbi:MAG: hypothetical protein WC076_07175 [Terrimicrobiaceae bacterium]|nr:hypothetical protein [Terrimicrobiaceae bacterium]
MSVSDTAYYALFKLGGKQIRRSRQATSTRPAAATVNDCMATARALFEQAADDGSLRFR